MIELIVRHAALLGLAAVLSLLLRHRSAALRHALWTATLALLLLLPLFQRVPITLPQTFSRPVSATEEFEKEGPRSHIQGTPITRTAPVTTAPAEAPRSSPPWGVIALAVYAAVTLALIARWGIGWALAARLARRATPLGTARGVPVLAARGVGPLTFGWPQGVILVPHERFAVEKLVLRHEVAHVERADFLWQGIGALACALWWWSPFVWLGARQLRREAERACDDFVLNQGVSAPDYADCLLEVAAMKPVSLPFAASLVQGELASRVTALLATGKDRRPAAPLAVFGITALLLPVGLTLTRPVAADVPEAPPVLPPAVPVPAAPRVITSAPLGKKPAAPPVLAPVTSKAPRVAAPRIAPVTPTAPVIAPARISLPAPVVAPAARQAPVLAPDGRLAPAAAPAVSLPVLQDGRVPEVAPPVREAAFPIKVEVDSGAPEASITVPAAGSLVGKRIVLDPGHGGTDHGAIYDPTKDNAPPLLKDLPIIGRLFVTEKTSEKEINLGIALNAAQRLRKEGAIVTLTRESDTFVPLNKRAELSAGQDLYLSIHVDSSDPSLITKKPNQKQFRVALWYHGAIAAQPPAEAQTFIKGLFTSFPEPKSIEERIDLGVIPDGKVYSSGFSVLRNAKCPAYLIDFGNMSWPKDVARLRQSEFQNMLAQGIVDGAKAILQ